MKCTFSFELSIKFNSKCLLFFEKLMIYAALFSQSMLKNYQFLLTLKGEVKFEPLLKFQSWKSREERANY